MNDVYFMYDAFNLIYFLYKKLEVHQHIVNTPRTHEQTNVLGVLREN